MTNDNLNSEKNDIYEMDGSLRTRFSDSANGLETKLARLNELAIEIDYQLSKREDEVIDYELLEDLGKEMDLIQREIETLPVTTLSIARIKISLYMNMLSKDSNDPDTIEAVKGRILGVFANFISHR